MARQRPHTRWLAISAVLLAAAACSGADGERWSKPMAASSMPESLQTPALSTHGVTSIDGSVMGGGTYPSYTIEAPNTWTSADVHFVVKPTATGVLGLSVWDVGRVPRNPCRWRKNLYDPGPTVDDLVAALATQRMRDATTPIDVTIGGYRGQYLTLSVTNHMVVTGDADFQGCDVFPSNGHRDFVSWFGDGLGERYEQVAGQVDRLWIIDVDGQRLVVDATYSPDTMEADRKELGQIAESLRFVQSGP